MVAGPPDHDMKSSSIILILAVLFIAMVIMVVGGVLIWFADSTSTEIVINESEPVERLATPAAPPPRTVVKVAPPKPLPAASNVVAEAPPAPMPTEPAVEPPPDDSPDWDAKLQDIVASGKGDRVIATELFAILGQLPPERQGDTAQLMAGLMPDEGYGVLAPMLNNPQLNEDVLDALMVDLLDRPDAIQLPLFLQIAQNPAHPRQPEALDYLGIHLDADLGNDWAGWQKAIEEFLRNPPEEL